MHRRFIEALHLDEPVATNTATYVANHATTNYSTTYRPMHQHDSTLVYQADKANLYDWNTEWNGSWKRADDDIHDNRVEIDSFINSFSEEFIGHE